MSKLKTIRNIFSATWPAIFAAPFLLAMGWAEHEASRGRPKFEFTSGSLDNDLSYSIKSIIEVRKNLLSNALERVENNPQRSREQQQRLDKIKPVLEGLITAREMELASLGATIQTYASSLTATEFSEKEFESMFMRYLDNQIEETLGKYGVNWGSLKTEDKRDTDDFFDLFISPASPLSPLNPLNPGSPLWHN